MPYASIPSLSRRTFALAMAGAGVSLLRSAEPEMHWALISDTHIPADASDSYRGFNPVANLKRVVTEIEAIKPEAILHCGDIARLKGMPADYEAVHGLMKPLFAKVPVAMAMGNHDHRKNFLDVFGKEQAGIQSVNQKHVLVVEGPAVRVIVLDSLMEANTVPGLLGKAQRAWLAEFLKTSSDMPTVLFVHHTLDDGDTSLLDAPRFFEILKPHRKVKAVLYGHSHAYKYEAWEGIHLLNLPAVGYNFNDSEPVGWVESRLSKAGGAFTLHAFGGNTEKNGKTMFLPWRA